MLSRKCSYTGFYLGLQDSRELAACKTELPIKSTMIENWAIQDQGQADFPSPAPNTVQREVQPEPEAASLLPSHRGELDPSEAGLTYSWITLAVLPVYTRESVSVK